jgi:DNA-binding NtrC family response regulator
MKDGSSPANPILIVDDEAEVVQALSDQLRSHGFDNLIGCGDGAAAMDLLHSRDVEVVLLDLIMPGISGQRLLQRMREEFPYIPVIIVTAANEIQTAVECMKAGAFDYMVKTVEENRLVSGIRRAAEIRELKREHSELRSRLLSGELTDPQAFSEIVTRSGRMRSIFLYIEAVAGTAEPVLITGETGVGKDLIARAVHRASGRVGGFIGVNAAASEEDKLSDDLFGHVKGAFTGAHVSREGLIQTAREGTLFLDEIGDLSGNAQIKLLRFLDNGEYYPLGSDLPKRSDARIVMATNRDLGTLVREGTFRKDLYYRVSTHHIHVPPLRARTEDLPLLIERFSRDAARKYGKKVLAVPSQLVARLSSYAFPGNIRELQTLVKNAVAMAEPSARTLPVQPILSATRQGSSLAVDGQIDSSLQFGDILPTLQQARALLTEEALTRSGRNISEAARLLGISHQALNKWLKRRKGGQKPATKVYPQQP